MSAPPPIKQPDAGPVVSDAVASLLAEVRERVQRDGAAVYERVLEQLRAACAPILSDAPPPALVALKHFAHYQMACRNVLCWFEENRRNWITALLVREAHQGVRTLREMIEDPTETTVTWHDPVIEVEYPVNWNWETRALDTNWTACKACTADDIFQMVTEATQYPTAAAMAVVTHGIAFATKGEASRLLPEDVGRRLDQMPQLERDRALDELYAVRILPPGHFLWIGNGQPAAVRLQVRIHHLEVKEDEHRAFFPVIVGILFTPPPGADPIAWIYPDPATWSPDEQQRLWDGVFGLLTNASQGAAGPAEGKLRGTVHGEGATTGKLSEVAANRARAVQPSEHYLLDGPTRRDRRASELVSFVDGVKLPKRWASIRLWDDLMREEIEDLQAEHGDAAFQDLRTEAKNPNARGPWLVKKYKAGQTEPTIELTKEARANLLEKVGYKGFRDLRQDKDKIKREYLVKRFHVGAGYIEVSLTWYGLAQPLTDEGRQKARQEIEQHKRQYDGQLFERLTPEERDAADRRLAWLGHVEDARFVMGYILDVFGRDGLNPVRIPARDLKILLRCEKAKDGFERIQGCLRALQEIRFHMKSAGTGSLSGEANGPFLAEVAYQGHGPGAHSDGDFSLAIGENFVGCLQVFCAGRRRLRDARKVLVYEWGKSLTKDDREKLGDGSGFLKRFCALGPFYDQAKGLTTEQSRLRAWLEKEITLRKDATAKGRHAVRVKYTAADADEPRLYGHDFCPLLPDGKQFHGVLGHFKKNAEIGRKLFGTATEGTKTSGPRTGGLLAEMGYVLPSGNARTGRARVIEQALKDLRAVVEEALGGIIAGRHGDRWLTLTEATQSLRPEELVQQVRWLFFLPVNWQEKLARDFEHHHAERHARGETPYKVKVTNDRAVHERANAARRDGHSAGDSAVGLDEAPLRLRLRAKRNELDLSLEAVGQLFGVSHVTAGAWERGTEPDEETGRRGKPIPAELVPMILRWIETGQAPSPEELAARKTARSGKAQTEPPTNGSAAEL